MTELESDARRRTIEKRWTAGGVEVRQVATLYRDLPVVEWTVYVKNISDTASQRVRLSALNDRFAASNVVVHAQKAATARRTIFAPSTCSCDRATGPTCLPSAAVPVI